MNSSNIWRFNYMKYSLQSSGLSILKMVIPVIISEILLLMNKLIFGSLSAVALSIGLYVVYNKKQNKVIERQQALEIVKKIRSEMYTILFDIGSFVQENASRIAPDQMREFLLSEQGQFGQEIREKLAKIFDQEQIDEETFEYNIKQVYKSDKQIQYHVKEYQEEVEKALMGSQPEFKEDCITFMGKQKVLRTAQLILNQKVSRIQFKLIGMAKNGGPIKFTDIQKILKKDQQQQEKQERVKILRKLGLVSQQSQISKIFEFCIAKYVRSDENFKERYQKTIEEYQKKMEDAIQKYCQEF